MIFDSKVNDNLRQSLMFYSSDTHETTMELLKHHLSKSHSHHNLLQLVLWLLGNLTGNKN